MVIIHGEQVTWAASPGIALGYLFTTVMCLAFSLGSTPAPAPIPDTHVPAAAEIAKPDRPRGQKLALISFA
jgi:AGZA family xanthine/uracil permease-like MFS transporter